MFLFNNKLSDDVAVITENGKHITYTVLDADVYEFIKRIKRKSIVFIIADNDYSSLLCYLASLETGAVSLLINTGIKSEQLSSLIQIYDPNYIFCRKSIEDDDLLHELVCNLDGYSLFYRVGSKSHIVHKDLALLLMTSGSTGSPKLVRLSKGNLVSNAASISKYLDINEKDRAITSLPFCYSFGLSVINSHLYSGASIVLTNRSVMESDFWKLINKYSVTSFSGVPYTYEILLRLGIDKLNIPSIKKMTQAGGKLDSKKIERVYIACQMKSIKFNTMYGQTEATARISYLPSDDTLHKLNSIGVSIPSGKLWVEDKSGNHIKKAGKIGELIYRGDNVSMGYAKDLNDLVLGDINHGVLKTGDLASFDEDGYFYIEGRKSRFVKIFGVRISLDSLERMLAEMGYISAVTGSDSKMKIHIVDAPGLSIKQFKEDIANRLQINMVAISVDVVKDLPRLETGKVNYKLLSQLQ